VDLEPHNTNGCSCNGGFQVDPEHKDSCSASSPGAVLSDDAAAQSLSIQEKCAICFETPRTFGLLVNCDHTFCLGTRA
jgi:E3 ubiquitin-protein ligase makorin